MSNNDQSAAGKAQGSSLDRYTVQPQQKQEDSPFYKSAAPSISLPKGGGALKGIDEKFSVNAVNGTAGMEIALPLSPGRGGFTPALSLSYNSGSGNSPFGLGWNLGLPSIRRKTDKQLPRYHDSSDSDTFLLAGAEDLIPALDGNGPDEQTTNNYHIKRYIPRIEGLFARIEYIRNIVTGLSWWRVTTKDNITTYYGLPAGANQVRAVVADPADNTRVFEWLPTLSLDHKGNVQYYEYVAEDQRNVQREVCEKNRLDGTAPFTNTYLKKAGYCNRIPYFIDETMEEASETIEGNTVPLSYVEPNIYEPAIAAGSSLHLLSFLMAAVFDYGDQNGMYDPEVMQDWPARSDAFSDFRAGFEIRTYRKCRHVFMYHYFHELADNNLVRALELKYKHDSDIEKFTEADFITSAIQTGYQYNTTTETWQSKSLPAVSFDYQPLKWNTDIHKVGKEDFIHAPQGLTGPYQWIDFEGEGISGILTEQGSGWFYKNNLGNGDFDTAKSIASKPNFSGLGNSLQWQDLDADGRRQVVAPDPVKGYWELDEEQQWQSFRTFGKNLNIDWGSPFTRMLDLNGDGKADILLTEDRAWTWYENLGKEGYRFGGNAEGLSGGGAMDEEKGPVLLLRDNVQSVFLADMNGDGMTDLVRIKNGEICYWPNMGYGKFGAKVTMMYAPVFHSPDIYNPQYLSLADISGTGAADLIYVGENTCKAWVNLAGNAWSESIDINPLPGTDAYSKIAVLDFLGIGTGCLVWSSSLPQHATAPLQYIDLMCGIKPYLMTAYHNGMGKTVSVTYKSSTQFYLEDKKQGIPWATRLPFPVQCVETITTSDTVSDTTYTQSYKYRHGYYDHEEREYRGFGYVETLDIDSAALSDNAELDQPPVLTKTWNHTGAWLQGKKLSDQYEKEYFRARPDENWTSAENAAQQALWQTLPLTLPDSETLSTQEWREAHRTLKGVPLRQEVYALDGTEQQAIPYTVTATAYEVVLVQHQEENRYASFRSQQQQSIVYSSERHFSDARIAQQLTLETDIYGNVLQSVSIVHPRLKPETTLPPEVIAAQQKMHITYSCNTFTNDAIDDNHYRLRAGCEAKAYEVLVYRNPAGHYPVQGLWTATAMIDYLAPLQPDPANPGNLVRTPIPEIDLTADASGEPQKRLLSHSLSIFQDNSAANKALPKHKLQSLAIPYQQYQLAFTAATNNYCYNGRVEEGMFAEGGYVSQYTYWEGGTSHETAIGNEDDQWLPSGTVRFSHPEQRFYTPDTYIDPWGSLTVVQFAYYIDSNTDLHINYWLLPKAVIMAEGDIDLVSSVESYDWRTLQPLVMMDANENISEILYDALGMPVATAIRGKVDSNNDSTEGDELETLTGAVLQADTTSDLALQASFWNNHASKAKELLGHATWRCIYDLSSQPSAVAMIAREQHYHADGGEDSEVAIRITYTDGLGRAAMHKVQCTLPPGSTVTDPEHPETTGWIGSGKTVYNNKGNAVMQYEPYFSATHTYDDAAQAADRLAVSPKIFYDALGRVFRTEMPDKSFSETEWTPWKQEVYDANDTVLDSGWRDDRITTPTHTGIYAAIPEEVSALNRALAHNDTPTVMHLDSLARSFYTTQILVAGPTPEEPADAINSYVNLDILGNRLSVVDGRELMPLQYRYNYLKQPCYQHSIDSGKVYTFTDAAGQPLYHWDAMERCHNITYDSLRRPLEKRMQLPVADGGAEKLLETTLYGDNPVVASLVTDPVEALNLRGQVYQHLDGAGKSIVPDGYDFKGNPVRSEQYLLADPEVTDTDWQTDPALSSEAFGATTVLDAFNRPVSQEDPGHNVHTFEYDKGGMLKTVLLNGNVYVADIHYDAKGQRQAIWYGNGTKTRYDYDEKTYRLRRLLTIKLGDNTKLQDLNYYYDPVGNITQIRDDVQEPIYYSNQKVTPTQRFTYDALYRLETVRGRELVNSPGIGAEADNWEDAITPVPAPGNNAVRRYYQRYTYDAVGNITQLRHVAGAGSYTRDYNYAATSNRLLNTSVWDGVNTQGYSYSSLTGDVYDHYDASGNMQHMPHLDTIYWNSNNELSHIKKGTTGAFYQYSGGQRIRKWINKGNIKEERIYLGNFEIYRKFGSGSSLNDDPALERTTIHISDDTGRIAMLELRNTAYDDDGSGDELIRYIYSNHLQSASLELDGNAAIITYEEYHPYGTTAYQAKSGTINAVAKRYRYTGKERDEESGLYYHGARYYIPWLCRWTACDPMESKYAGMSPYNYSFNNPVVWNDLNGADPNDKEGQVKGGGVKGVEEMIKGGGTTEGGGYGGYGSTDGQPVPGIGESPYRPENTVLDEVVITAKKIPEKATGAHKKNEQPDINDILKPIQPDYDKMLHPPTSNNNSLLPPWLGSGSQANIENSQKSNQGSTSATTSTTELSSFAQKMLDKIHQTEGGYVDNPNDPGGKTKYGIAEHGEWPKFAKYIGLDSDPSNIKNITEAQADKYYIHTRFEAYRINEIHNDKIANALFDQSVLTPGIINRNVKRALNDMGYKFVANSSRLTNEQLNILNSVNQSILLDKFISKQLEHYESIKKSNPKNYYTHINGWKNRLKALR